MALTTEVRDAQDAQERARCEWPKQDLFAASLLLYVAKNTCVLDQFWSQDNAACVPRTIANSELVDNVCAWGFYIRGCDAISHMVSTVVEECQPCVNVAHNAPGSFE